MLKRQTNKLITLECFLTLHSPICSPFLLSFLSVSLLANVIYWTECRPSRKVEMRDKFNNQYFSNFNWNAFNELMRRNEKKSKALSGFHSWIYKIDTSFHGKWAARERGTIWIELEWICKQKLKQFIRKNHQKSEMDFETIIISTKFSKKWLILINCSFLKTFWQFWKKKLLNI